MATYSISGTTGVAGATVNYTGQATGSVTCDGSGNFTISGLNNGDYFLSVSETGVYNWYTTVFISDVVIRTGTTGIEGVVVNNANVTGVTITGHPWTSGNSAYSGAGNNSVTSQSTGTYTSFGGNHIFVYVGAVAANISSVMDTVGTVYTPVGNNFYHGVSAASPSGTTNNVTVNLIAGETYVTMQVIEPAWFPPGILGLIGTQNIQVNVAGTQILCNPVNTQAPAAFVMLAGSDNGGASASSGANSTLISVGAYGGFQNLAYTLVNGQNQNFTAGLNFPVSTEPMYLSVGVWGFFTTGITGNCGAGGATVGYSGPKSGSVTADINGNYFIPFAAGSDAGTYTVTPSGTGLTFSPASNTVSAAQLGTNVVGPNFTASTTITSGPTYTVTESTIVATWTTAGACNSQMFAGAKAAVDNSLPASETTHFAVVTGLSPSTSYSCYVQSLGVQSSPTSITTAPARARFQISGASFSPTFLSGSGSGDTFFNYLSNDGNYYCTMCDGTGISGDDTGGSNASIQKITSLSPTLTGVTVNAMTALGAENSYDGQDAPEGSNAGSTKKWGGAMFGVGGNLFAFLTRQSVGPDFWEYRGGILMSPNHGTTWGNWENPGVFNAAAIEPFPVMTYEYASALLGDAFPVRYAPDDGTLGYNTAGNQIDGGNAWMYSLLSIQGYPNYFYMMRTARRALNLLVSVNAPQPTFQYWIGPTSPAPSDFVNDSNWSSSVSGATQITVPGITSPSWTHITYIPVLNSYIWSGQGTGAGIVIAAAPTPAGPWTSIVQANYSTSDIGAPCLLHGDAANNTASQNLSIRATFSGVYTGAHYAAQLIAGTFTTSAYPISGNVGVGGATITYTGTSSGSVVADALGYYTISNLANGTYTITPSASGHTFSPADQTVTVNNAGVTGTNFTVSGAYSVPDCRDSYCGLVPTTNLYPNGSRAVQGTEIYDVETSNNAAVPGTDSRAAGAPVDSRVAPNIPENSRTPGTFGPGE